MTKLIWMSDLHFANEGDVMGHNPRVRLQAAIDHINSHHADAEMCMVSGDMVNKGTLADYQGLQAMLLDLAIPYYPMTGNHDCRNVLKQVLPVPDNCMDNFIQYKVPMVNGLCVCLDTHKTGTDAGELCHTRTEWLRTTLTNAGNTPVYLFMHHPPMSLGLPMQDSDNMENGQDVIDLVSEFDCVEYLFIGHVHRPVAGTVGGIAFATMRSVLYQAPPPRPDWTWGSFKPAEESPDIGVVHITGSSVIVQYEKFCEYPVGVKAG